jgi:hypothetical protein
MKRLVQPEILDSLPQDHPDAIANRRDLRLINGIMGNYRWFARTLPPRLRRGDRVLEIGAGTGDLGLALSRACRGRIAHYCGLDFWSRPDHWPADWDWVQQDLLEFKDYGDYNVIVANLILHQFEAADLRRLGQRLTQSNTRLILASEPARRRLHQWQLKLLRPFGLNPVSRHDGHVSVAGGFRGQELPALLGLSPPDWRIHSRTGFLGSNRTVAQRTGNETN